MTDTGNAASQDLASLKLPELRKIAAEKGLRGTSALRKGELIQAITTGSVPQRARQRASEQAAAEKAPAEDSREKKPQDKQEKQEKPEKPAQKEQGQEQDDQRYESRSAARRARRNRAKHAEQEQNDNSESSSRNDDRSDRNNRDNRDNRDNSDGQGSDRDGRDNRGGRNNRDNRDNRDGDGNGRRGRRNRRNRRNRDNHNGGGNNGGNNNGNNNQDFDPEDLQEVAGIVDIVDNNAAFVRTTGYRANQADVFINNNLVRRCGLRSGDAVIGQVRANGQGHSHGSGRNRQRYNQLVRVDSINGMTVEDAKQRPEFHKLTPLYPNQRLRLETEPNILTTRVIDLVMPIGKGQRALIVSPPKAGKTTILQNIANAIAQNNPECYLMVVLVDERPEEVTDMQRSVKGEVIASTFDRPPSEHTSVSYTHL